MAKTEHSLKYRSGGVTYSVPLWDSKETEPSIAIPVNGKTLYAPTTETKSGKVVAVRHNGKTYYADKNYTDFVYPIEITVTKGSNGHIENVKIRNGSPFDIPLYFTLGCSSSNSIPGSECRTLVPGERTIPDGIGFLEIPAHNTDKKKVFEKTFDYSKYTGTTVVDTVVLCLKKASKTLNDNNTYTWDSNPVYKKVFPAGLPSNVCKLGFDSVFGGLFTPGLVTSSAYGSLLITISNTPNGGNYNYAGYYKSGTTSKRLTSGGCTTYTNSATSSGTGPAQPLGGADHYAEITAPDGTVITGSSVRAPNYIVFGNEVIMPFGIHEVLS